MIDDDPRARTVVGPIPDGFAVCVHRGTHQIGGTCIELAYDGERILLDLGMPLDVGPDIDPVSLLPPVAGLQEPDPSLRALVLTHGHADHWGLAPHAGVPMPIVAGAATHRILTAAAAFVPRALRMAAAEASPVLADRRTIRIGPFAITPYLIDHSAYDAYSLLVEAKGRRLFYSGDLRAHGRKAALFERLVAHPPQPVHAMLMEGSSLGRLGPGQVFPTEDMVEKEFVQRLRPDGFVGVCASAQNIDRVVGLYRACKRTGRTLYLDLYAMEVLRATGNEHVPAGGWPNLAVYVPEYQRRHIARTKQFELIERYKPHRVYRQAMAPVIARGAMLFRPAMMDDIDMIPQGWRDARMIWSQWDGYLGTPANTAFRARLNERGVPLEAVHTSGHASVVDLQRLAAAIAPDALVPVHTFSGDRFAELFGNHVQRRTDGEWWQV